MHSQLNPVACYKLDASHCFWWMLLFSSEGVMNVSNHFSCFLMHAKSFPHNLKCILTQLYFGFVWCHIESHIHHANNNEFEVTQILWLLEWSALKPKNQRGLYGQCLWNKQITDTLWRNLTHVSLLQGSTSWISSQRWLVHSWRWRWCPSLIWGTSWSPSSMTWWTGSNDAAAISNRYTASQVITMTSIGLKLLGWHLYVHKYRTC